jgi:hypothetical protein
VDKHFSSLDYIFFMSGVFTQLMVKAEEAQDASLPLTKQEMWKPLVHSFRAMYSGVWPEQDPTGQDYPRVSENFTRGRGRERLAGGYKIVLWVNKGDMDFNINHYEQPGHWQSDHPCPSCPCERYDNSPMRWNDFSPQARWMTNVFICMTQYAAHCHRLGKSVHLIFKPLSEGGLGMHIMSQYKDALHVADLGVTQHICGNILWHLCYTDMLKGTPTENMAQVWGEISDLYWARGTSSQFSHMTLNTFCEPEKPNAKYPHLKGKGAEARHLVPILRTLWHVHARPGNRYEGHIGLCIDSLNDFYEGLDYNVDGVFPFHLPTAVSQKLLADVVTCLQVYSLLTKYAFDLDKRLWNLVPKHHYLWHLAHDASHLNPRMAWCYSNEDFVGKLAVIGMSTRHGQAAAYRSRQLVDKYTLGITLRMFHAIATA